MISRFMGYGIQKIVKRDGRVHIGHIVTYDDGIVYGIKRDEELSEEEINFMKTAKFIENVDCTGNKFITGLTIYTNKKENSK